MFVSPALLIQQYLISQGAGSAPSGTTAWGVYRDKQPPKEPDECITVYETTPVQDGRIMRTGEYVTHPGIMVNVRSLLVDDAKAKMYSIKMILSNIKYSTVTIAREHGPSLIIIIASFSLISGPVPLGEDDKNRKEYTLNGTMTIAP